MPPKKQSPAQKARVIKEFDVELTLLKNRQVFLYDEIDDTLARKVNEKLFALDAVDNDLIHLYINTPGGDTSSAIAIINTIRTIDSPVVTIIQGEADSAGAMISVVGDKRVCYENSCFMTHDIYTEFGGGSKELKDRANYVERYYEMLDDIFRQRTKLTKKDLRKAREGELWLFADEMLKKGVVDEIMINTKKGS